MRRPIIYASLIIVLAMLPVLFLEGVSGAFYKPIASSYILALAASFVVALIVTPALSMLLLKNGSSNGVESPITKTLLEAGIYKIHTDGDALEQFGFKSSDKIAIVISSDQSDSQFFETTDSNVKWSNFKYFNTIELETHYGTILPVFQIY